MTDEAPTRPTKYKWLPRALEFLSVYRMEPHEIEAVIDHPTNKPTLHPASGEFGYPIRSFRRGDLEACVSFKDPADPVVAYVYFHLPIDNSKGAPTTGTVRKAAAKAPKGLKEFKQRVHDAGYRTKMQGGHCHVLRPNGSFLLTVGGTPSNKQSITNAWQTFLRQVAVDELRQDLGDGHETE